MEQKEKHCPICEQIIESTDICPYCGYRLVDKTEKFSPVVINPEYLNPETFSHEPMHEGKHILRIVRGPQNCHAQLELSDKTIKIGRKPSNDLFLNDFSVSRLQATVTPVDGAYKIKDNKSFNGMWINNVFTTEAFLKHGDLIQLGAYLLLYEEE